jgi:hypothetical protein
MKNAIPLTIISMTMLVLVLVGGSAAMAEDVGPQSPAQWEQGVNPNECDNSGAPECLLNFHWHVWDWVGEADYYTFSIEQGYSFRMSLGW